jgi:GH43 family beta-xylosidase
VPGHVVGPGHCSVVEGPTGGDVLVYHAWDVDLTARRMCIDPLEWTAQGPVLHGPTWQPATLPD